MLEIFSEPAGGLIGLIAGGLITGFFTYLVQKDKSGAQIWKDVSNSEKDLRTDLLHQIEELRAEVRELSARLDVANQKVIECSRQHAEAELEIKQLRARLDSGNQ